jgi:lipopolysaccharide export system permease protein
MGEHSNFMAQWRTTGPFYVVSSAFAPIRNTFFCVILILECVRFKLFFGVALHQPNPALTILKFLGLWLPLYMGIGVQLALFVGLMFGLSQIAKTRELDALHAVGYGLHQLMAPIAGLGLAIALLAMAILGWMQPLSLYASKVFLHDIEQSANLMLAGSDLFLIGGQRTIMLDKISSDGNAFERVFVYETYPDGKTVASAGINGRLMAANGFNNLHYFVHSADVMELSANPKSQVNDNIRKSTTTALQNVTGPIENADKPPFRKRGESEYEWTLGELYAAQQGSPARMESYKLAAELNYRLAQMFFILLLPFMAAITVIEPRRNPSPLRFFTGVIVVLGFYQYLSYGASISRNNIMPPLITLWIPLFVLYAIVMASYWRLAYRPAWSSAN